MTFVDQALEREDVARLIAGRHPDPHRLLGAHPAGWGVVVRALHPDAESAECVLEHAAPVPMTQFGSTGVFTAFLPGYRLPVRYRFRFRFLGGATWEQDDPYRFLPSVGEIDEHLFSEGTHRRLWNVLGAHPRRLDGVEGVSFSVWAPSALGVSVVGDFCRWDERRLPMRRLGTTGVFEIFVPGVSPGALYKYRIVGPGGEIRMKADPVAQAMEPPPGTASRVVVSSYQWGDGEWMAHRPTPHELRRMPMTIYEVHLGSWMRVPEEGGRPLTYREIAPKLIDYVTRLGFTHVEFLPLAEHPFTGSWGYQVSAYFAPTARYGTPDDLRFLIDACHCAGIGVILDWVPAHFPKDDFALRQFDGTALYEHADPRQGEHPEWGTLIFNFGRREVRNFLDRERALLARGVSRRWVTGGCRRLDALSRLRPCRGGLDSQCCRWPRKSGGSGISQDAECDDCRRASVLFCHGGGVDAVARRHGTGGAWRPRFRVQVEHGMDARHAGLFRHRSALPIQPA